MYSGAPDNPQPRKSGRVLLMGEDSCAFLATIRSLGRYGLEVHVAWCPPDAPALKSRYIKRVHNLLPYREGTDDWINVIQTILGREQFDLVLPITDATILPFQLHREKFEPLAQVCLLPNDTYRICSDKSETYKFVMQMGIALPKQRLVRNADEAIKCTEEFGYPLVLKPIRSAESYNGAVRQAVRKARNEDELRNLATQMTSKQAILVQENFIGVGTGVEVLCRDGEVLTAFQHERIHEPMNGGGSSLRKSVPLHDGMYAATCRLMKSLRYTGVAMAEFKRNRATGEWLFIEINPRFWGSLPLSIVAGLDFPRYLYAMSVEGRTDFPRTYRTDVFCRNWTKDMQWFLANMRADKKDLTLQSRPLWSVLLELKNVALLREANDTLTLDDPRPAWTDLWQFFSEKAFRALKLCKAYRKIKHKQLVSLYRSARTVIVVCHGNICRSPFAAALLNRITSSKVVVSAGMYAASNRKSPCVAVQAAADFGVDLTDHSSRTVTNQQLRSGDLIIVFDRKNWLAVRAVCPQAMPRVAYLGAADPSKPLEISDPVGGTADDFQHCYSRIEDLSRRLVKSGAFREG
jgi:protein-tyrosine-phosphatase/predicted ATP-grasp superfamily ATP-dependent carboligase